jgi:hypothetical protein
MSEKVRLVRSLGTRMHYAHGKYNTIMNLEAVRQILIDGEDIEVVPSNRFEPTSPPHLERNLLLSILRVQECEGREIGDLLNRIIRNGGLSNYAELLERRVLNGKPNSGKVCKGNEKKDGREEREQQDHL